MPWINAGAASRSSWDSGRSLRPPQHPHLRDAIALRIFIAAVACTLFGLGILGATHERRLWQDTIGPQIKPKVLPAVFDGVDQTVHKVLSSSTVGLLALAAALAVWEVSGIIRASIGALDEIYETPEERPWWVRFPLSFGLAILVLAATLGAIAVIWAGHAPGSHLALLLLRWPVAIALVAVAFQLIVRWAPAKHRPYRWASFGSALVVVGWIGETLIFGWYVRSFADFRTSIGCRWSASTRNAHGTGRSCCRSLPA